MKDIKFFNETFAVLLGMTVCAWALYIGFVVFVGDVEVCAAGAPQWLLRSLAFAAGLLTAPPLLYGLARIFLWPNGQKDSSLWMAGWIIGWGVGIFVTAATLLAMAISQYGCR